MPESDLSKKYEFIANTSKEFMTLINRNFVYEAVNDSYCEANNRQREEIIGCRVDEIWGKQQFNKMIKKFMERCFNGEEVHYQEWFRFCGEDKKFYDVAYYPYRGENNEVTHIVVVTRDITDRKLLEEQLLQTEHLAGIGELASGIAHEIRNPVAIINSTAQYCHSKYRKQDPEITELMNVFIESSAKIDKTIRNLLEFAKPQKTKYEKQDLLEIIRKICQLLEGKCAAQQVELKCDLPESLPKIYLDENQMDSLFLNLLLNALDAMPDGGVINLEVSQKANEIMIKLTDTGCGIKSENINKIANPFFTTKKDGTGLGLSLIHRIIKFHNGKINFVSRVGIGTEITIHLPSE